MGGGAILDLGCYILQFQQYVFRGLKPIKVTVNGHLNSYGTDESCGAIITYPGGKMAVVSTSARVKLPNEGVVAGTKGTLTLPDFWAPTKLITPTGVKEWPLPESSVPFIHHNSCGLRYEAEEVRKCILAGKLICYISKCLCSNTKFLSIQYIFNLNEIELNKVCSCYSVFTIR